ncbi:MAG: hypothetical protein SNG49_04380 [Rikenellaceae bacterium]
MFSRAIRFLLVIASVALLLTVALSADSFTSMIPESFKAKITSIVEPKEAEAEAIEVIEPVEEVEEIEEIEEVDDAQQPSEEIEPEQADTIATTTIEREE